jgi:hypothetical protein
MSQLTNQIMMIRPANFGFNEQTAANNSFQSRDEILDSDALKQVARNEFDEMVSVLRSVGVNVTVIEDTEFPVKPDAVFPNNWISFHENGSVITYPMFATNRRIERREDIIEALKDTFDVKNRYSFEFYEIEEEIFLEGTGSMIFDRPNKIVYACLSERTDVTLINKFCVLMGYKAVTFRSLDRNGKDIYHTNVMMALGKDFVVICLDSVHPDESKKMLLNQFEETDKVVIEITYDQMEAFAGNMLEVLSKDGKRYLVMSQSSYDCLTDIQMSTLKKHTNLLPISIKNIEKYGGGSVRCMMAEVFLPKK